MAQKIIIAGALGRMGMEIAQIVLDDNSLLLSGCLEYPALRYRKRLWYRSGKRSINVNVVDSLDALDCKDSVLIDFSSIPSSRMFHQKF